MEIVAKFRDAMSMFWQALDASERRALVLFGVYVLGSVAVSLASSERRREHERIVAQVKEELRDGR